MGRITLVIHKRILEKKKKFEALVGHIGKKDVARIEKQMQVEFVYNSNKMEGSTLTLGETKLVLEGITVGHRPLSGIVNKSLDDIRAARNHPGAMDLVRRLAFDRTRKIGERDVRAIHRMIMGGIIADAGKYRTGDVGVVGAGFTPPPPYTISESMKKLAELVNRNPDELTPIDLAAQAHYDLAWVHPFSDGNGRISRLLLNLILIRNGYPFTVIRDVDRKTYLRTLRHMDATGEIGPFVLYIARCVEQTLDVYLHADGKQDLLPLRKLAQGTPYSAEYLSLLARKGRIDAVKRGKTWLTTKKIISAYVKQQKDGL